MTVATVGVMCRFGVQYDGGVSYGIGVLIEKGKEYSYMLQRAQPA